MRLIDADNGLELLGAEEIIASYKANDDKTKIICKRLIKYAKKVLRTLPTIDAEPVKNGHWISDSAVFFYGTKLIEPGGVVPIDGGSPICSCHCSVCGKWLVASDEYPVYGNYCPNCGAKMDEVSG